VAARVEVRARGGSRQGESVVDAVDVLSLAALPSPVERGRVAHRRRHVDDEASSAWVDAYASELVLLPTPRLRSSAAGRVKRAALTDDDFLGARLRRGTLGTGDRRGPAPDARDPHDRGSG
jgi:hypothetical protein